MWKPQCMFTDYMNLHIRDISPVLSLFHRTGRIIRIVEFCFRSTIVLSLLNILGCLGQETAKNPLSTTYFCHWHCSGNPVWLLPAQREEWGSRRLQLLLVERAHTDTVVTTFLLLSPWRQRGHQLNSYEHLHSHACIVWGHSWDKSVYHYGW